MSEMNWKCAECQEETTDIPYQLCHICFLDLRALQARLKLADDLVRKFVHRNSPMTPQQREAWEKWNTSSEIGC